MVYGTQSDWFYYLDILPDIHRLILKVDTPNHVTMADVTTGICWWRDRHLSCPLIHSAGACSVVHDFVYHPSCVLSDTTIVY